MYYTGNHKSIFKAAGFSSVKEYRYWKPATRGLDFEGMLEDLRVGIGSQLYILKYAPFHEIQLLYIRVNGLFIVLTLN